MIRSTLHIILTLFCSIFSILSYGQETWSLQNCIDYALENNIQVKREKLKTILQEENLNQAKWDYAPDLNASFAHSLRTGYSINEFSYLYNDTIKNTGFFNISSSTNLFSGLKKNNTIKINRALMDQTLAEYHYLRNNIILTIAGNYLEILLSKEILEVAKNQLEGTILQAEKMKQQVDVGNVAQAEYMKIKALEANDKLLVIQAENEVKLALLSLTQLLELESFENFNILFPEYKEIDHFPIPEVSSTFEQALLNLPQIKGMEAYLKTKELELQISRADLYPNLDFRIDYNSWYLKSKGDQSPSYKNQFKDQSEYVYSLEMSIPIFNRTETYHHISRAKIALLDAGYQLEQKKKELYKQIQQAYVDAVAAYNKNNAAEEAVTANEEAFKYTEQKFNVGLVNSVDYYLSKNELLKARSELVNSKYEYIFKVKILDFYTGKPFTL